jgi:hypothetical protein
VTDVFIGIFQWSEKPCCIILTNGIIEVAYTSINRGSANASICSSLNGPAATTMPKRSRFFCVQKITPSTYAARLANWRNRIAQSLPHFENSSSRPKVCTRLDQGRLNQSTNHPYVWGFISQSFFLGIEASKIIMRVVILHLLRISKDQTQPSIC